MRVPPVLLIAILGASSIVLGWSVLADNGFRPSALAAICIAVTACVAARIWSTKAILIVVAGPHPRRGDVAVGPRHS